MEMDDDELLMMLEEEDPGEEYLEAENDMGGNNIPLPVADTLDSEEQEFLAKETQASQMDEDEMNWLIGEQSQDNSHQARANIGGGSEVPVESEFLVGSTLPGGPSSSGPWSAGASPSSSSQVHLTGARTSSNLPLPQGRVHVPPSRNIGDIPGEALCVTTPDGARLYVQVDAPSLPAGATRARGSVGAPAGMQLLSEPIDAMLDRLEEQRFRRVAQESERLAELGAMDELERRVAGRRRRQDESEDGSRRGAGPRGGLQERKLWVDKYKPQMFTQLLSQDQSNRDLLRWMKAWDSVVFGVAPKLKPRILKTFNKYDRFVNPNDPPAKFFSAAGVPLELDRRPKQKLVLLSGPPGLGKTTLAHVVAQHCGYNVVEINASDDRSAEGLCRKIQDAVEFQAVMGERKPNCVVVDEIDGIMGGSEAKGVIDALLRMLRIDRRSGGGQGDGEGQEGGEGKGRKKKKQGSLALQRPIICVCNDASVAALRPLREVAAVFRLSSPHPGRLYKRLSQVCKAEELQVEGRAIGVLCAQTECDVRSCLHTLQFLARKSSRITVADVTSSAAGKKDVGRQAMQVWEDIFFTRKPTPFSNTGTESKTETVEQREFARLYNDLCSGGDDPLMLAGVHENLLAAKFHDVNMGKTRFCLDWLAFADCLMQKCRATMNFGLLAYVPMAALSIRRVVAQPVKLKLNWPMDASRVPRERTAQSALASGWMASVVPRARCGLSLTTAIQDIIPHLLTILAPALRAVPLQMLNTQEQTDMYNLVDTMIEYGVSYSVEGPTVSLQGSSAAISMMGVSLVPALEALLSFESMEQPLVRRTVGFALRQMVNQEVKLESSSSTSRRHQLGKEHAGGLDSSDAGDGQVGEKRAAETDAMLLIQKCQKMSRPAAGGKDHSVAFPVLYKYNEGFTNAVKRNVKLASLWQV